MYQRGVLDFAGGLVIHTSVGFSCLVFSLVVPKRKNHNNPEVMKAHNIPISSIGTAAIYVAWFGFNGGSTYGVSIVTV